jgi:hypothetical protein
MAKSMRNMQVPAYCPVDAGFQDEEKRAVVLDVKNVMVIWSIPIIMLDDELSVDVGMAMPAAPVVDDPGMGIVIDMSIFTSKGQMTRRISSDREEESSEWTLEYLLVSGAQESLRARNRLISGEILQFNQSAFLLHRRTSITRQTIFGASLCLQGAGRSYRCQRGYWTARLKTANLLRGKLLKCARRVVLERPDSTQKSQNDGNKRQPACQFFSMSLFSVSELPEEPHFFDASNQLFAISKRILLGNVHRTTCAYLTG